MMSSPFSLPDWVPWWAQLLLLIVAILFLLALFLMPFSVFGLKSRLETIEARLDEIQGEIRVLALRLPEPGSRAVPEPAEAFGRAAPSRPPVPPAAWTPDGAPRRPIGAGVQPVARQEPIMARPRSEPRLDRLR
jgi:hypothetical protein